MKDDLKIRQTFDAFIAAQAAFDDSVEQFKSAYDAAELAMQAKAKAGKAMAEQLAEVDRLADELADLGAAGPDIISNEDMAGSIRKGRVVGVLHAKIGACPSHRN
jgi:hypothetical protein